MFVFMCIIMVLAGILLIAAILIQPGKGAGLSAGFGGAGGQISNMFGVRRTTDFLQKFTIGLAAGIIVLALVTNKFFISSTTVTTSDGERAPITTGAAKPPAQPVPQGNPQGSPQQGAPQGKPAANPQTQPAQPTK